MAHSVTGIKTAIVGFGLSATVFHIPFILSSDRFDLVAVSSTQKDLITAKHPGVQIYAKAEQMMAESAAELVIITATNDVHFALAELALKNDKHVIIEKPFVINVEQGQELISLANSRKKIIAPYHNRRWDGDFLTVKQLVADDRLGEVKVFESHFDRFRPQVRVRWRELPGEGSGILYDLGPHLIDQALALFGKPLSVTGRCLALRQESAAVDYFHLQLHYPDKEIILHSSPFAASPNIRFQVQGSKGAYIKYGLDPQEGRLRKGQSPDAKNWAAENEQQYGCLYTEDSSERIVTKTGGYQHFFANIAAAITTDAPLAVTPEEALASISIIRKALQSAEEGRTINL